ncbi:MAG: hypothetical protein ABIR47_11225 [Candidatus Kapaibacterium sp.]
MALSQIFLVAIVFLIPVIGFIMTISHARKGFSRQEQRWRKRHGLLFWVLIPSLSGLITILGHIGVLPNVFGLIGIIMLSTAVLLSRQIQQNHKEL